MYLSTQVLAVTHIVHNLIIIIIVFIYTLGAISKYIGIVENFKFCAYGLQHGNRPVRRNTSAAVQPTEGMHHAFSQRYQQRGEERTSPSDDRCFKCGLRNHKTYECRHKNQIQCYHCKLWGHKDSVCWDF